MTSAVKPEQRGRSYGGGYLDGVVAERARCAKIVENFKVDLDDARKAQDQLAALIRGDDEQREKP